MLQVKLDMELELQQYEKTKALREEQLERLTQICQEQAVSATPAPPVSLGDCGHSQYTGVPLSPTLLFPNLILGAPRQSKCSLPDSSKTRLGIIALDERSSKKIRFYIFESNFLEGAKM